jgi:hypothetical protein
MIVRKITNTSASSITVKLDEFSSVCLAPQQMLENVDVRNLETIRPFVSVEYDLSEVPKVNEGRTKLFD